MRVVAISGSTASLVSEDICYRGSLAVLKRTRSGASGVPRRHSGGSMSFLRQLGHFAQNSVSPPTEICQWAYRHRVLTWKAIIVP
jgi:hypothetical protein